MINPGKKKNPGLTANRPSNNWALVRKREVTVDNKLNRNELHLATTDQDMVSDFNLILPGMVIYPIIFASAWGNATV